jgi:phage gp29-like protein
MPTLLDARGQPIQREALDTPQTAQMASLHREFANHPGRGLTPQRMHTIFLSAEQGDLTAQADLFDDMEERDAHILAEMGKRRRAMLTLEWRIAPPRNATAAETRMAEEVTEWLLDVPDFEDVQLDALSAIGHGYSCQELEWQRTGSLWLPRSVTFRAHSWFTLDRETRTNLRLRAGSSMDGEPLTPFGWIVHTHKAKSGYLARGGLFRSLAWPYLLRNYSARALAGFLEIHGLPLRLG